MNWGRLKLSYISEFEEMQQGQGGFQAASLSSKEQHQDSYDNDGASPSEDYKETLYWRWGNTTKSRPRRPAQQANEQFRFLLTPIAFSRAFRSCNFIFRFSFFFLLTYRPFVHLSFILPQEDAIFDPVSKFKGGQEARFCQLERGPEAGRLILPIRAGPGEWR